MEPWCDLPDEDLVAYQEGALRGARLEWVAAHAQACAVCRQRLAEFADAASAWPSSPRSTASSGHGSPRSRWRTAPAGWALGLLFGLGVAVVFVTAVLIVQLAALRYGDE